MEQPQGQNEAAWDVAGARIDKMGGELALAIEWHYASATKAMPGEEANGMGSRRRSS